MSGEGDGVPRQEKRLTEPAAPPGVSPDQEPPADSAEREERWVAGHGPDTRDTTPATGAPGGPAAWRRARAGAEVVLARRDWGDARWSFLYEHDTAYADREPLAGEVAGAARRMRGGPMPAVQGPVIKPPVWTWEVPLYFWFGGIAAGSGFVALACDLAGDHRSAVTARKVALAAVMPSPPLLIADLGRPERFLNMLRIVKPRSPMNMGAWALVAFSTAGTFAVGADALGRARLARALGAANAVVGGYLGSYTGVLLASTAVPVWARSRLLLGPVFVATATATGAAATRLALVAGGLPVGHPTRNALGSVETGAMLTELTLSALNERRLGRLAGAFEHGRAGTLSRLAKRGVLAGLLLRLLRERLGARAHHAASVLYLASGLAFRYAWMEAGRTSAGDHEAVARMARGQATLEDRVASSIGRRTGSRWREARRAPAARVYAEAVRRASLAAERLLRRG